MFEFFNCEFKLQDRMKLGTLRHDEGRENDNATKQQFCWLKDNRAQAAGIL